ncbi:MAG: hypothetical protein WC781_05835 [Candidatus Pacearchaeota archaeon]|jgi:hypothetical protein
MTTKSEIEKEIEGIKVGINLLENGIVKDKKEGKENLMQHRFYLEILKAKLEGYNLGCKETAEEVENKWKEKVNKKIDYFEEEIKRNRSFILDGNTSPDIEEQWRELGEPIEDKLTDKIELLKNLLAENQEENKKEIKE